MFSSKNQAKTKMVLSKNERERERRGTDERERRGGMETREGDEKERWKERQSASRYLRRTG